jgi:hypothetical protein
MFLFSIPALLSVVVMAEDVAAPATLAAMLSVANFLGSSMNLRVAGSFKLNNCIVPSSIAIAIKLSAILANAPGLSSLI